MCQSQYLVQVGRALLLVLATASLTLSCHGQPAARPVVSGPIDFAGVVARLSEPDGYFDTDNLISNETSYLHVMSALRPNGVEGGAYLGVGPAQNFAYIARQRPELAVILDIRRDNLLLHLLYKALFTMAPDRSSYLALHFARRPPANPPTELPALLDVVEALPLEPAYVDETVGRVLTTIQGFGVPLDEASLQTIERFYRQFIREGLGLQFNSHNRAPRAYYPTYRQLMLQTDLEGNLADYLVREEDYQFLRTMQREDRVVPVVGDFAGSHALVAIGDFLKERGLVVKLFYTSNVEYYLSSDGVFGKYIANVRRLPIDEHSVFVRSLFNRFSYNHPQSIPGHISTQLMQPIGQTLASYEAGELRGYGDLVMMHLLPLP